MPDDRSTCPCPKCGQLLLQSGEMILKDQDGQPELTLPTFQCEDCIVTADFLGEPMEVPLTFCRLPDGSLFDPADPEGKVRF